MTSITHATSSSTARSVGRRRSASTPTLAERFRFGPDSKVVRVGLGVAIAAVMAGDVYAVLRSPVSEGSSGSAARGASAAPAEATAWSGRASRGFVATNPFSEAAYGADLASRMMPAPAPVVPASSGPAPAAAAPAVPTAMPAASAPVVVPASPLLVAMPALGPAAGPSSTPDPSPATPPATAEPTLVQEVVATVADVPVVGGTVAPILEEVVEPLPVSEVAEELTPVVAELVAAPSELSL